MYKFNFKLVTEEELVPINCNSSIYTAFKAIEKEYGYHERNCVSEGPSSKNGHRLLTNLPLNHPG